VQCQRGEYAGLGRSNNTTTKIQKGTREKNAGGKKKKENKKNKNVDGKRIQNSEMPSMQIRAYLQRV
jgi:hypothetical protein